jgi:hypothetical protein
MVLSEAARAARRAINAKRQARAIKALSVLKNEIGALPKVPKVILDSNYVNPITLEFPKGVVIYEIKNRFTGRKNYYTKATFKKLITRFKSDYNLMLMNPKSPIPSARNPVTRNPIYPRNVRRVTVKAKPKTPSKSAAARKIQSAVRAHLKKKKAAKK